MKIYLAIPYSQSPELSYDIANYVASLLMRMGHIVFSPISHSHSVNTHMPEDYKFHFEFWMNQDLPFVEWADEVWIADLGGDSIKKSRGVQREIQFAKEKGKPIMVIGVNVTDRKTVTFSEYKGE